MTQKVYHYSKCSHQVGDVVVPGPDSYERISPLERQVEDLLRPMLPNGHEMRSTSLFTWENEAVAVRMAKLGGKKLYELEVEESSIVFRSDLNHYNDAKDALNGGTDATDALRRYCASAQKLDHHTGSRVEVLVRRGVVTRVIIP